MQRRAIVLATLLFIVLACAATYPIARFDHPQVPDADDSYFNVWRLSWVAYQLPRDPRAIFDANIFHPAKTTLAYSDAMLALGVAGAPFIWLGVHPVIVHNLLILASFVTAALGAFLLCRYLTGSTSAAIVGGLIFGFAPYRFAHIMHLELLWTAPMPLALLVLHRATQRDKAVRDGLLLGGLVALQAYCSLYYAAFLALFIGLWALLTVLYSGLLAGGSERRRIVSCVAIGAVAAVALTAPYGFIYYQARQDLGARDPAEIQRYSAQPTDYLQPNPGNRFYRRPPLQAHEERSLLPGMTAALLAGVALVGRRDRVALLYGVLLVLAFDLSLGLNGLLYPIVSSSIPLLNSLRAPSRFSSLFLVALSVLAAIGVAWIGRKLPSWGRIATVSVVALACLVEYWSAPISVRVPILRPPTVHRWLSTIRGAIVVEMPVPEPGKLWAYEPNFQYLSIYHWNRLVNGYSGYPSHEYLRTLNRLDDFPTADGIARLKELGVQYVVLHERMYEGPEFVRIVNYLIASPDFNDPLTMPDAVDPVYVFPLRPGHGH
jgi:hypothetical protein